MTINLRPYSEPRPFPSRYTALEDRLASAIDWPGNDEDCWEWRAAIGRNGYGQVFVDNKARKVHRVVYELLVGPIPDGLTLDHLCRNRACCNPAHLEPVTMRENALRGDGPTAHNARKTHCIRGHELTDANTYDYPGMRACRICARQRSRRGAR